MPKPLKLSHNMRVISTCRVCGTSIMHDDERALQTHLCGGDYCAEEKEPLDDIMKRER